MFDHCHGAAALTFDVEALGDCPRFMECGQSEKRLHEESRLLIVPAFRDQAMMSLTNFFDLQRINMEFTGRLTLTAQDFVYLLHAFH